MNLTDIIYNTIRKHKGIKTWIVAYSGGVDSHVLLHLFKLTTSSLNIAVKAIHINHGLNPNADKWAKHCLQECQKLNIPLETVTISVKRHPQQSLEAIARKERYDIIRKIIDKNSILVTGHHIDDQAETLLLQLFRGSGVKGLASMPISQSFGNGGMHIRPLLPVTRDSINQHAKKYRLNYIDDDSNDDIKFTRNFIRHQIMPLLKKQWPSISSILYRSSQHCADADHLLKTYANAIVSDLSQPTINITRLKTLSGTQQKNILRQWISANHYQLPSTKQLEQIANMIEAKSDKQPTVKLTNYEIRRYQGHLYISTPLKKHNASQVITWDMSCNLTLPNGLGVLNKNYILSNIPASTAKNKITVQFRQGGERWKKPNHPNTHCVKKLMQDEKIEPWLRDRIPLIYEGDMLIYVDFDHINQLR